MGITRRRFVVATSAAVCVGCSSGADEVSVGEVGTSGPSPSTAGDSSTTSTTGDGVPAERFGARLDVGAVDDLAREVERDGHHYVAEARSWVVRYPPEALGAAEAHYGAEGPSGIALGFVALYQKCPHLGCRVPACVTSGRFECPCHGSRFSRVGEWIAGPAPRGMDRFPVEIVDGRVFVDTVTVIEGADHGVVTLDQEAIGPGCVGP